MSKPVLYALHGLTLLAVALSYVLNLGWYRVMFAIVLVPYFIAYSIGNALFIGHRDVSPARTAILLSGMASYVGLNLSLVDFGDVPPAYACFGLIELDGTESAFMLAFAAFVALHAASIAAQIATTILAMARSRKRASGRP